MIMVLLTKFFLTQTKKSIKLDSIIEVHSQKFPRNAINMRNIEQRKLYIYRN